VHSVWVEKFFVYDASAKIPLIIYDPRLNRDTKIDKSSELLALVDIAPTQPDLTGIPTPEEMQGRSVKPLMLGVETVMAPGPVSGNHGDNSELPAY
jgi:arylsulfatase A-like enzyme